MVLPVGIAVEFCLLALFFLSKGKRRVSAVFLIAAVLVLWVSSMPIVAASLYARLERDYPPVALADVPVGKCIVVLGGAVEPAHPPRMNVNMLEGVDRVRKTARLFRAGKGQLVIVTGGNQPWMPHAESEAESIKTLLQEWGVPAAAVVLEGASRNTRENAVNTTKLIKELECGKAVLVTSAAHMTRSVAVFRKLGLEVFPVSTDIRAIRSPGVTVLDFLPSADALKTTSDALREWIGQRVYRLQGWA